ncbi:hypothetical protein [uncultured Bifidobacterium sp.]|uniref:hypothetical protein n=1 Tax=uncultured Bifidobacterium sp. TaxID=165187 RepID=UPI002585A5AD|nr:hypothetical protein [uncultured Bifidobacterium sp.]
MAKVRTLGPGSLKIGDTDSEHDFSADVTNTALEPSTDTEDPDNFLDGHSEGGSQTESWTLTGSVKEDFSMDGLQVWCNQHSGEELPFTFIPNKLSGTVQWKGKVTIASIQIGGDVKSKNANDFSFAATDVKPSAYTPAGM